MEGLTEPLCKKVRWKIFRLSAKKAIVHHIRVIFLCLCAKFCPCKWKEKYQEPYSNGRWEGVIELSKCWRWMTGEWVNNLTIFFLAKHWNANWWWVNNLTNFFFLQNAETPITNHSRGLEGWEVPYKQASEPAKVSRWRPTPVKHCHSETNRWFEKQTRKVIIPFSECFLLFFLANVSL